MRFWFVLLLLGLSDLLGGQSPLPQHLTNNERQQLGFYTPPAPGNEVLIDPPTAPVRTMAEWEELQAIVVTWPFNVTAWRPLLRDIVAAAAEEVTVYIVCASANQITAYLNQQNVSLDHIELIEADYNTVWVRDYGPNTIYTNAVDSLHLVDWIYNRPRPADDRLPERLAEELDLDVYATTEAPTDLVHTGGNFMADGMGTGFSSDLVLDENDQTNPFGQSNHDSAAVHQLMRDFMGIERYALFGALPYDGINHIDMHMKLLDEETLLVAEFPEGVSDGPAIEANLAYLQDNFLTPYGNPYRIVRIPQPPCENGLYPPFCQYGAEYRTYTNALFVNKTILVPVYLTPLDAPALDAWRNAMPGYRVVGIDCRDIITYGGAIHCITKEIGVNDPLLINHATTSPLCANGPTELVAEVRHRSGIEAVELHYRTPGTDWQFLPMTATDTDHTYRAAFTAPPATDSIHYYFRAQATSGKSVVRPLPAPVGYFARATEVCAVNTEAAAALRAVRIQPNPTRGPVQVLVELPIAQRISPTLTDVLGRVVWRGPEEQLPPGEHRLSYDWSGLATGNYQLALRTARGVVARSVAVLP